MAVLEATLAGSGTSWTATLTLLTTAPAVEATGTSAAAALGALIPVALRQVATEAAAQSVALGPVELVAAELRIRAACSLALFRLQTPTPTLTITDPYGTDVSTFPDLDPRLQAISGQRAVAEAVARRWLTPLGALVYDPTYGEDIRALLNAPVDQPRIRAIAAALAAQAEADERVQSAEVTITSSGPPGGLVLAVKGRLISANGPFVLVLTISQLNANLEVLRA